MSPTQAGADHAEAEQHQQPVFRFRDTGDRRHYVRAAVEVREYAHGALAIFHGPRRLADYTAEGVLITQEEANRLAA